MPTLSLIPSHTRYRGSRRIRPPFLGTFQVPLRPNTLGIRVCVSTDGPAPAYMAPPGSGYNDTRLTTEGRKIVDTKSVHKPRVHVFKVPHNIQPQCTLYSTHTPIDHEPASLDDTDTHNTRIQVPAKRSGSHGIHHASIAAFARTKPLLNTTSQTNAVVRIRTTLHSSSKARVDH